MGKGGEHRGIFTTLDGFSQAELSAATLNKERCVSSTKKKQHLDGGLY